MNARIVVIFLNDFFNHKKKNFSNPNCETLIYATFLFRFFWGELLL